MALIAWIVHAEWPTPVKHPPLDAAALAVADGYSRDVARHDRRGADRLSRGPAGYPLVQFDGVWKAGPFRRWRRTDRTLHTVTYHYARRTAVGCVTADETLELGTVGAKWYVVRLIDSSSETQTPSPDRCA